MKISELQKELEIFKGFHGDRDIEFLIGDDELIVSFEKIREGYNMVGVNTVKVCEIRLDDTPELIANYKYINGKLTKV